MTLILQNDESDCLLACYAMVLDSLGTRVTLAELQQYRKDQRRGTSVGELRRANDDFGVLMSAVRVSQGVDLTDVRKEIRCPVIAHLWRGHFVVLVSISKHSVRINDPALGVADMALGDFLEIWSGVLISFTRSPDFMAIRTRPHPISILRHLSKKTIALLIGAVILSQLVTLGLSMLSKLILDGVLSGVAQIVAVSLVLTVLVVLAAETQQRSGHFGVNDYENNFAKKIFRGLSGKDFMWVKNRGVGRVVELVSLRNQVRDILLQDLGPTVVSVMTLVPVFAFMIALNAWMALILGLGFMLYLYVLMRFSLKRFYQYQGYVFGQVEMSGAISSDLNRWKELIIRRSRGEAAEVWSNKSTDVSETYKRCLSIDRDIQISTQLFSVGSSVLVVALGALMISNGAMSLGDLVIIQLLNSLLSSAATTIQRGVLSVRNLGTFFYSLLDVISDSSQSTSLSRRYERSSMSTTLIEGSDIEVCFGEDSIFSPKNLTLSSGDVVEIRGPSGSGKTTFIDALFGVILSTGVLRYSRGFQFNEVGISSPEISFQPAALRAFVDPYSQESDAELMDILWAVGLNDIVTTSDLNNAPSTFVSSLSTGQMQRLSLARSLVLGKKVVIWDEPFGTLDMDTAELIVDRVFRSAKYSDRAFIIVTHQRLSNFQADRVVHMP